MKWAAFCLDLLILAALGGCGAFAVYTGLAARRWTALRKNPFLYPVGLSPEDCLDPKGFLRFIRPRVLVFGVLYGIFSTLIWGVCWLFKINYNPDLIAVAWAVPVLLDTLVKKAYDWNNEVRDWD